MWSSKKMADVITASMIIHNLVAEKQWPLMEDVKTGRAETFENVRVGEDVEDCFEKLCGGDTGVRAGTIGAISCVRNYLLNTFEYMRTRRLVLQHVTTTRYVYSFLNRIL